MALRASNNKITFKIFQNFYRGVSNKFESPNKLTKKTQEEDENIEEITDQEDIFRNLDNDQNFRYNVCQERTTPIERPTIKNIVESKIRTKIEEQSLQPAVLPEFYHKSMNTSPCVRITSQGANYEYKQKSVKIAQFEHSKTQTNLTRPLKPVKLANPFPEPVKLMDSHKVADDEKAELMLNESKQSKFSSCNYPLSLNEQKRDYSTNNVLGSRPYSMGNEVGPNPDKCKKVGKKKGGCPKMVLDCCDPIPPERSCERPPKDPKCKKQLAPYPAYSEFCHEELIEKPSECKLCPWRPDENPNFKPPKKHFHSLPLVPFAGNKGVMCSASKSLHTAKTVESKHRPVTLTVGLKASSSSKGLMSTVRKNLHTIMAPKAVAIGKMAKPVTLTVGLKASNSTKSLNGRKIGSVSKITNGFISKRAPLNYAALLQNGMLCDLRKRPCSRPEVESCEDRERREKERKRKQKEKNKNEPKKAMTASAAMSMTTPPTTWTSLAQILMNKKQLIVDNATGNAYYKHNRISDEEEEEVEEQESFLFGGCGKKKDKCKKFPFPHVPIKQEKDEVCKKKKKNHSIDDCGGVGGCASGGCGNISKATSIDSNVHLHLQKSSVNVFKMELKNGKCGKKDKNKKCPQVDLTCKEEEEEDPCNTKRRGTTQICPGDLLNKKRRKPRKKTSGLNDDVKHTFL